MIGAMEVNKPLVTEYMCPLPDSDFVGLEKIDPRLSDRIWRLNNLYMVLNENGEKVRFRLRPAQEELLQGLHYRDIILKARQLGFTTFVCILFLDFALFNKNKQIGIVAHTQDAATVIFQKVKVAWDNFDPQLKIILGLQTSGDSKTEHHFNNGSRMKIATSFRSGTFQAMLITEFGKICSQFPEKANEIVTGTFPTVHANGLLIIESTAEGETGSYYDMCNDAMELKENGRPLSKKDYKFFFFPWYQNKSNYLEGSPMPIDDKLAEYFAKIERELGITLSQEQKNWYYLEQKTLKNKMKQEHPSTPDEAFLSSGNKLFTTETLEAQKSFCREPFRVDGDYKYYKPYMKGHMYVLGADVAKGTRNDHSTMVVLDITTGETVMTYKSNEIDPVNFAYDIKKAALEYGGCLVAPENNNVGYTTCVTLKGIYSNIYTEMREDKMETVATHKLGWNTSLLSKPKMMYEVSEAMDSLDLKIIDSAILREARKFNKEDSLQIETSSVQDSESKTGSTKHFDLLIALAIAWQVRIYATRGFATSEDISKVEENRSKIISRQRSNYR